MLYPYIFLLPPLGRKERRKEEGSVPSCEEGDERLPMCETAFTHSKYQNRLETIAIVRPKLVSFRKKLVFSMLGLQNL